MIDFAEVDIGRGPQVSCSLCAAATVPTSFLDPAEVGGRLRDLAGQGTRNVVFCGVEPLKHPRLPVLVGMARDAGMRRIALATDARGLAVGGNARGAVAAGLRQIHVPLLGPTAADHDGLLGEVGAFDAAVAGLAAWREALEHAGVAGALLGITGLCRHSAGTLPETVARFAQEGAAAVKVRVAAGTPDDVVMRVLDAAFETGMVNGVWIWPDGAEAAALDLAGAAFGAPVRCSAGEAS